MTMPNSRQLNLRASIFQRTLQALGGVFLTATMGCTTQATLHSAGNSTICSGPTAEVLTAALKYGLQGSDSDRTTLVPDYSLASEGGRILLKRQVSDLNCNLDSTFIPTTRDIEIKLVSARQLDAYANQRGGSIPFAWVSKVEIENDTAHVYMGVAIHATKKRRRATLCCCGADMLLRRENGIWVFDGWGIMICA